MWVDLVMSLRNDSERLCDVVYNCLIAVRSRGVSVRYNVQTATGAHSTSHTMDTGHFIPEVKRLQRKATSSFPSEVKG